MTTTRFEKSFYAIGVALVLVLSTLTITNNAIAGPFHGKHGMGNPLERMLDHIDLTDDQTLQVEQIMATLPEMGPKKRMGMMKEMIQLNPEDPDYLESVQEHATKAGLILSQHIQQIGQARKDIYEILTDEQKLELTEVIERKMKRMEKRMADR